MMRQAAFYVLFAVFVVAASFCDRYTTLEQRRLATETV